MIGLRFRPTLCIGSIANRRFGVRPLLANVTLTSEKGEIPCLGRNAASFAIDCVSRLKIHTKIHYPGIRVDFNDGFEVTKIAAQVVLNIGAILALGNFPRFACNMLATCQMRLAACKLVKIGVNYVIIMLSSDY